jgi:hypothetical protein
VAPGEIAIGYVYFSTALPPDAAVEIQATGDKKQSGFGDQVSFEVVEVNRIEGEFGSDLVGTIRSTLDHEVSGPISIQALCLDAQGNPASTPNGFADGDAIGAGSDSSFSISLGDDPCPTFLVGATAYDI